MIDRLVLPTALCALFASLLPAQLKKTVVASGLAQPLFATSPPGDSQRLFIVLQHGRIVILQNGTVLARPFLDIGARVQTGGERGLLGLAFHPHYDQNGFFFVNYSQRNTGATILERFQVSSDPNVAAGNSGTAILNPIPQPAGNHNGGCIQFGPDGYLYIGLGDGGFGGDPNCRAQDPQSLLGKMLRIDVDSPGSRIPPTNPFTGDPTTLNEIWATGLRNPWRFSFDRQTGDLYIGDVGQSRREEIDFQPGNSTGGENYGWKIMEGDSCFSTSRCQPGLPPCHSPQLTLPIHAYQNGADCSVIGGYVYRGCAIPGLAGTYFFGDHCSGRIWSFRYGNGKLTEFRERTAELGGPVPMLASFAEDADGELYAISLAGTIYRIEPTGSAPASVSTFGTGCPGSAGVPTLAPVPGHLPWVGETFSMALASMPDSVTSAPIGVLGFSKSMWEGFALPQDLALFGLGGCTQYVSVDFSVPLTNSGGSASWDIDIPCDPNLIGLDFYVQALVHDLGVNPGNAIVTNAIEGVVGAR